MSTIRTNITSADMKMAVMRYNAQQADRVQDEMAQHFWVMIGTANQVAYMAIEDAVEAMQAEIAVEMGVEVSKVYNITKRLKRKLESEKVLWIE